MDRGKPGSKIHVICERFGLPLHVDVSAANVKDHRMLQDMLDGLQPARQPVGWPPKRPVKLHGDKGYDYPECRGLLWVRNIVSPIARKCIESVAITLVTNLGQSSWPRGAANTRRYRG